MASSEPVGQLEHVGIVVADLDAAKAFLSDVLGLELGREAEILGGALRTAFFAAGPIEVELVEIRDAPSRAQRLGEAEARLEHLSFVTADLERARDTLAAHGVELRGGIGARAPESPLEIAGSRNLFSNPATSLGLVLQIAERR